ncbi:ATP-binding protein [Caldicellulosiruptor naganoensis]|uniref:Anti-sigma regulatory factor n=1 Tax=Caldicellulosiruptor naganoensis TaxID=29324 RepID=A0ABY7BHQ8_9FIRM|nr:anti-sigma regulatory factor [Caldicellulosiruptor naganoensis]WAM31882.1 anti-sigma regulatory factor [Caldicellulosiruptor naganoensis]
MHEIMLTIPSKAEYIMVVRLTLSGIAARCGFDFETIEDLKMAISEVFNLFNIEKISGQISIRFEIDKNCLGIEIDIPTDEINKNELAEVILKTLMDDVEFEKLQDKYIVRLKKYH